MDKNTITTKKRKKKLEKERINGNKRKKKTTSNKKRRRDSASSRLTPNSRSQYKSFLEELIEDQASNALDVNEVYEDMKQVLQNVNVNLLDSSPDINTENVVTKNVSEKKEPNNKNPTDLASNLLVEDKNEDKEDTFSDVDDKEIDCYILSPEDVKTKIRLWHYLNKDYLKEKEEKLKQKLEDEQKPKTRKPRKKTWSGSISNRSSRRDFTEKSSQKEFTY